MCALRFQKSLSFEKKIFTGIFVFELAVFKKNVFEIVETAHLNA